MVRKRAFKPKSTTGCVTCKIRRVKCDEGKPACHRCESTGRKCDGYQDDRNKIIPRHDGRYRKLVSGPIIDSSHQTIVPSISIDISGSYKERYYFDFFRRHVVLYLSSTFDSSFWKIAVLQGSHHELAIRHGAIALGCLYETFKQENSAVLGSGQDTAQGGFALHQYLKAIGHLVQANRNGPQDGYVSLIACILFTCYESIRGHLATALDHIDGGIRILSELESRTQTGAKDTLVPLTPYISLEMIRNILTCLDTTATYMVDNRSLLLYRDAYTEEGGLDIDIPNCFTSLEQASNAANFLYNAYTRLMQLESGVSEVAPRHERLLVTGRLSLSRLVENWKTALDSFMRHSSPEVIRNEMAAINTLKVQMMGVSVLIQAHNQPDQTLWDRLTPQFQEIVSLASTVISASAPALPGRRPTPTFSFDTGIVAPLFLVGFKCYNRRIRRQAIALLFAASRQEGIWNSLIVARVVQRVLEIEEEGCDYLGEYEVLPTWARLTTLGTQMDRGGRGYFLQYRRTNGSPLDPLNKIVEECMEW